MKELVTLLYPIPSTCSISHRPPVTSLQARTSCLASTTKGHVFLLYKDLQVKTLAHRALGTILSNESKTRQKSFPPYKEGATIKHHYLFACNAKESPYPVSHNK